MSKLQEFIELLEQEVKNHSIYVWGAQGQTGSQITEKWIRSRESGTGGYTDGESYADAAVKKWQKEIKAGYEAILAAFDCSGLGVSNLQKLGLITGDMSADGMQGKCNKITKSELKCGDWCFYENTSGKASHICYIVDDQLNIIEAKGRRDGVVKRTLQQFISSCSSSKRMAYGRPLRYFPEIEQNNLIEQPSNVDKIVLQKGNKGEQVTELQQDLLDLGYKLPKFGADGDFGNETVEAVKQFQSDNNLKIDGIVYQSTMKLIEQFLNPQEPIQEPPKTVSTGQAIFCTGDTVNVREGPGTSFNKIGIATKGQLMLANSGKDGWANIAIVLDGEFKICWISEKYIDLVK